MQEEKYECPKCKHHFGEEDLAAQFARNEQDLMEQITTLRQILRQKDQMLVETLEALLAKILCGPQCECCRECEDCKIAQTEAQNEVDRKDREVREVEEVMVNFRMLEAQVSDRRQENEKVSKRMDFDVSQLQNRLQQAQQKVKDKVTDQQPEISEISAVIKLVESELSALQHISTTIDQYTSFCTQNIQIVQTQLEASSILKSKIETIISEQTEESNWTSELLASITNLHASLNKEMEDTSALIANQNKSKDEAELQMKEDLNCNNKLIEDSQVLIELEMLLDSLASEAKMAGDKAAQIQGTAQENDDRMLHLNKETLSHTIDRLQAKLAVCHQIATLVPQFSELEEKAESICATLGTFQTQKCFLATHEVCLFTSAALQNKVNLLMKFAQNFIIQISRQKQKIEKACDTQNLVVELLEAQKALEVLEKTPDYTKLCPSSTPSFPFTGFELAHPTSICFFAFTSSPRPMAYVSDSSNRCVAVFDCATGKLCGGFTGKGTPGRLKIPTSLAVSHSGELFIVDGGKLSTFSCLGEFKKQVVHPPNIFYQCAIDHCKSEIHVTHSGSQVAVFDFLGSLKFEYPIAQEGAASPGGLPYSITVDGERELVYVTTQSNESQFYVFDTKGQFLKTIPKPPHQSMVATCGGNIVISSSTSVPGPYSFLQIMNEKGELLGDLGWGKFEMIKSVNFGPYGEIFVCCRMSDGKGHVVKF